MVSRKTRLCFRITVHLSSPKAISSHPDVIGTTRIGTTLLSILKLFKLNFDAQSPHCPTQKRTISSHVFRFQFYVKRRTVTGLDINKQKRKKVASSPCLSSLSSAVPWALSGHYRLSPRLPSSDIVCLGRGRNNFDWLMGASLYDNYL